MAYKLPMEAKVLYFNRNNPSCDMPAQDKWYIPEGKELGIPLVEEHIPKIVPPLYDLCPQLHALVADVLSGPLSGW